MIEKVFFKTMNSLGPYEKNPHLAVAVSGGCDSLCLAILAKKWVDMKGGRITALIVDHSLRKTSNQESKKTQNTLKKKKFLANLLNGIYQKNQKTAYKRKHVNSDIIFLRNGVIKKILNIC